MSGGDQHDERRFAEQPGPWRDWQAVSMGERPLVEVEEARRTSGESVESLAYAGQLFRAYDEQERESLVDGLLGGLGQPELTVESAPLRPRPRATKVALVALLATAAVLALWIAWPSDTQPDIAAVAPVPSVSLQVTGAIADDWSDSDSGEHEVYHFAPNAEFVWILRPDTRQQFEAEVRAFVIDDGHERALGAVKVVPSTDTGAVKIEGTISGLGLERGTWTIVLVYGRPGQVSTDPHVAASLQDGDDVQVERFTIVIESRLGP